MSKQVGFKLLFDGTNKSINEMKEVESALAAVSAKIVSLKSDSKSILDPLIKSQTALKTILTTINKLLDEQSKSLNNSKLGKTFDETVVQKYTDKIKILKDEILKLQIELKNKPINPINLDGTKEKIQASLEQVKQLAPAFDKIATGGANNLFNKIAAIDSQLKIVNTNLKAAQKNDTGSANDQGNISQLLAQQSALIASKKLLKQESVTLATQLTKESKNYDPTSIIGMRLELVKLEKEYINLGADARNSAEGLEKFNKLVSLSSTVNAEEQKIGIFKRNVGNYRDAVNGLIPTLQKLSSAGLLSQKELLNLFKAENKAKVDALQKEIEQLSEAFLKLSAAEKQAANGQQLFSQLNGKITELGNTAVDTTSKFSKFGQGALSIGNVITGGLIGGGLVIGIQTAFQGIKKAINISAELTDVQSDVRKTTELTIDQVKQLTESFKNIDTRTTTKGLLEIAAIAGQLGVEGVEGVEAFTKSINVVTVALGDDLTGGVDQIAGDLSKLSNVLFGATTDGTKLAENIGYLGNTLNVLAASGAATGDKMLEFGTRIGSTLVPLGATAAQVLALSATFDSLNINPEKGATAINNLVKDIGANTALFAKTLNLSQNELRNTFNTNPIEAFNVVLKKLNDIAGGDKTKVLSLLKDLKQSGEGVSTIFFQMGTNQQLYNNYLAQSDVAITKTSSLTKEYETKNNNLAGSLDKLSKRLQDIATNPSFILFFDQVVSVLSGVLGIVAEVGGALGSFFGRISTDVVDSNGKTSASILGLSLQNLTLSDSNYIVGKSLGELNNITIKETAAINATIKAVQDENISKVTKSKLIDELVAKYPDLLDKYDLEFASTERLGKIQQDLTDDLKKQTFERIKIKTKGLLEEKLINEQILFAELELGRGLNAVQNGLAGLFGVKDKVINEAKQNSLKSQSELEQKIKDLDETFNRVATNNGLDKVLIKADDDINKINDRLRGLLNGTSDALESETISQKAKDRILQISKEADQLRQLINAGTNTGEFDSASGKQALEVQLKKANKLIADFRSLSEKSGKEIKGAGEKTLKELGDSNKKIIDKAADDLENLKRRLKELEIGNISDQFKKETDKINNDLDNSIKDLEKKKIAIPLTANDIEINKTIEKTIAQLRILNKTQVDAIALKEAEAIQAATNSLINIKNEITDIIKSGSKIAIESNIETAKFELQTLTQNIELKYTTNEDQLKLELAKGAITQKEFDELIKQNTDKKLTEQLDATKLYVDNVSKLYDELKNIELSLLDVEFERTKELIKQKLIIDNTKLDQDKINNPELSSTITDQQNENTLKAIAEDKAAEIKLAADKKKLEQQNIDNKKAAADQIIGIAKNQTDAEIAEAERAKDKKLELLKTIRDSAIDLAGQASAALFEIDAERDQKIFEHQTENLEKEKAARLKLAKGNAQEEEKINAEFDAKKKKLDKENFENNKKRATNEALINGALAVIKTFATYGFTPIGAALAAAQAIATAIQIAKIKSTTFAKGGRHSDHFRQSGVGGKTGSSNLPKDETGERPVGTATFHADEYTMPRIQTQNNSDLVEVFEDNRKALFSGRQNDLRKNLMSALIRGQKQTDRIITPKNNTFPALYQKNYFSQSPIYTNNINDSTLDSLAVKIAASVKESIVSGTMEAYEASTQKIIENTIRFNLMENTKAK